MARKYYETGKLVGRSMVRNSPSTITVIYGGCCDNSTRKKDQTVQAQAGTTLIQRMEEFLKELDKKTSLGWNKSFDQTQEQKPWAEENANKSFNQTQEQKPWAGENMRENTGNTGEEEALEMTSAEAVNQLEDIDPKLLQDQAWIATTLNG